MYLRDADDDATANWGGRWRMPTNNEQEELVNNCYWVWTSNYSNTNTAGYIIYKAKSESDKDAIVYSGDTPSDNYSLSDTHISLAGAGRRYDGSLSGAGTDGCYWLVLAYTYDEFLALELSFSSNNRFADGFDDHCYGQSVRAVCK